MPWKQYHAFAFSFRATPPFAIDGVSRQFRLPSPPFNPAAGGFEAVYDDMAEPTGMLKFAGVEPARGRMFSARERIGREGRVAAPEGLDEDEIYRSREEDRP